jgi:flagellar basal body-associated protein FliL
MAKMYTIRDENKEYIGEYHGSSAIDAIRKLTLDYPKYIMVKLTAEIEVKERKMSSELSTKAVRQKTYMHRVLTILKEEGLYKTTIPQNLFMEINKRISENYRKGLTTMKCVNDIAKQLRQVA